MIITKILPFWHALCCEISSFWCLQFPSALTMGAILESGYANTSLGIPMLPCAQFHFPLYFLSRNPPNPWIIHGVRGYECQPRISTSLYFRLLVSLLVSNTSCPWAPAVHGIPSKSTMDMSCDSPQKRRFTPPRRPLTPDNGRLFRRYPLLNRILTFFRESIKKCI